MGCLERTYAKMMKLLGVEMLNSDLFKIVVGNEHRSLETLCRFEMAGEIRCMNFDSDEFNKLMMKGEIDFFDIREAIKEISLNS